MSTPSRSALICAAEADAAVDGGDRVAGEATERLEHLLDLTGELAGRGEDDGPRVVRAGRADARDEGEAEGEGLARAGRRPADDVAAGEHVAEGGSLDRGGDGDSCVREVADDVLGQAEVGEGDGRGHADAPQKRCGDGELVVCCDLLPRGPAGVDHSRSPASRCHSAPPNSAGREHTTWARVFPQGRVKRPSHELLDPFAHSAMEPEVRAERLADELAVLHHRLAVHDRVPALTGPQRSQASTGSAMRAGEREAVERPARRRRRPRRRESEPISPAARGSRRRPARRHLERASRAGRARRPAAQPAEQQRVARASIHSDAESVDDEPSHADADGTPAARKSVTGAMPAAEDQVRARAVRRRRCPPRRAARSRPRSGITQCATHVRSLHQPTPSKYSIGRHPNVVGESSSSSTSSARWVCRRTSSRSASSAVRPSALGRDRERRARGERDADHRARATGRGGGATSALAVGEDRRRRPARPSRAAGRRPSATGTSTHGSGGSACRARGPPRSRR